MNRKLLLMIAAICGAVMLICILLIPVGGEGKFKRNFIETGAAGVVMSLIGIAAAGGSILLFLGKSHFIGSDEGRVVNSTFAWFGLAAFLGLAVLLTGDTLQAGFWLYWIASLAGGFFMLLAANPALAKKIAAATKEKPADDGE